MIGSTWSPFLTHNCSVLKQNSHGRVRKDHQYQREVLDVYVECFYERALDCCQLKTIGQRLLARANRR